MTDDTNEPHDLACQRMAALAAAHAARCATPEGQEALRRQRDEDARREATARLHGLVRNADRAGCPMQARVRQPAFAPCPSGPFIEAVDEVLAFACSHATEYGAEPALRVFLAPPGVGKSVALVYAVAVRGVQHGPRASVYVTAAHVARTHRQMHDNRDVWAQWIAAEMLAIDEIGTEEKPGVVAELLLDRWAAGGVTLMAGNMGAAQFAQRYLTGPSAAPLADRLREQAAAGLNPVVVSTAPSLRLKPTADAMQVSGE